MNLANLTLVQIIFITLGYWIALLLLVLFSKARPRAQPEFIERVAERNIRVTFTETIPVGRIALFVIPPAVLWLAWILIGS